MTRSKDLPTPARMTQILISEKKTMDKESREITTLKSRSPKDPGILTRETPFRVFKEGIRETVTSLVKEHNFALQKTLLRNGYIDITPKNQGEEYDRRFTVQLRTLGVNVADQPVSVD